jgi:hypothetical protein
VPNRHFRHFPADLRPRCSRSAEILCINPSDGGPRVRIHLPPAGSLLRNSRSLLRACASGATHTGAAPRCGPGGHAGRVGTGISISQAKHERLCAEPSEIPSDATAILLVSPAVMPLQILFFAQDLTVEQPCGRPGVNQCYPIWEY